MLKDWERSYESYFQTFDTKLILLETTQGHPVAEREKKNWLRASIKSEPDFHSSFTTMKVRCAMEKRELTYEDFFSFPSSFVLIWIKPE